MSKESSQEEIRRIVNEVSSAAEKKALEISSQAIAKAAEVADLAKVRAAEVSSMAISKALDASTLAAEKAAAAATAAASVATATSLDLSYIKSDIAATKLDIKSINDKLDNKYVTKDEFKIHETNETKYHDEQDRIKDNFITRIEFSTVKSIVYGLSGMILVSFMSGIIYLVIRPH